MPEPKEPSQNQKQKIGIMDRYFPRFRNWLKIKSRKSTGAPFHEVKPPGQPITTLQIFDDLQESISYSDIGTLNKEAIEIERRWDGGVPEWEKRSASAQLKKARNTYRTLGPFYDTSVISKEMKLATHNYETVKESITINIVGLGKRTFVFSLPKEHELVYNHGMRYKVGYIGHRNDDYYNNLKREITDFCNKIEKELQDKAVGNTKKTIEQKISSIKELMANLIDTSLYPFLTNYENTRRSELSKLSELANQELGALQQQVIGSRLVQNDVVYVHTYKVINNHITKTVELPRKEIVIDEALPDCHKIEDVGVKDEFLVDIYFSPEINPTRDELEYVDSMLKKADKNSLINKVQSTCKTLRIKQTELSKCDIDLEKNSSEIVRKFFIDSKIIDKDLLFKIKKSLISVEETRFYKFLLEYFSSLLDLPEEKLNEEAIENFASDISDKATAGFKKEGVKEIVTEIVNRAYPRLTELHKKLLQECKEEKSKLEKTSREFEVIKSESEQHKKSLGDYIRFELRKEQLEEIFKMIDFEGHLKNFELRDEELEWGLDKNGYPLEVAEKGYVFGRPNEDGTYTHEAIEEGTILLDVFNNNKPFRKVPLEWTDYCDTLDMATWIYCHYDSYRDDLRDGRHHNNSLSITDYLLQMKETETPYLEFEKNNLKQDITEEIEKDGKKNKIVKKITKTSSIMQFNGPPFPKNIDKERIKVEIEPTHLNPAFDLRRGSPEANSKKDKHLGKKLYYDIQDSCEKSKNPTMTTRGAALYILANVIERVKYFNEAKELLAAIGDKTDGFDIGPNLQLEPSFDKEGKPTVEAKRWGARFTKDPFSPIEGQRK